MRRLPHVRRCRCPRCPLPARPLADSCSCCLAALQRTELATAQAASAQPGASPTAADQWGVGVGTADIDGPGGQLEHQPLLFYSVRPLAAGAEPEPLQGAALDADPLPIQWDSADRLAGQVHRVEAGRVHGFACLKGAHDSPLEVVAYVDGVEAGRTQAALPTQSPAIDRLCQLEAALPSGAMEQQQPRLAAAGATGVGFVVPLPALPAGTHAVSTLRQGAAGPGSFIPAGCRLPAVGADCAAVVRPAPDVPPCLPATTRRRSCACS